MLTRRPHSAGGVSGWLVGLFLVLFFLYGVILFSLFVVEEFLIEEILVVVKIHFGGYLC